MDLAGLLALTATQALAISPLVVGLVQGYKQTGMPGDWSFPASVGTGIALGVLTTLLLNPASLVGIATGILTGVVAGLIASGLYSGVKDLRADKPPDQTSTLTLPGAGR